ncbi:hypothetical protein ABH920_001463 [Catenulispora sp. EB89]|uniref:hypothetical protein n=1 Tax=Catenulispora sp. EB89 TaxID=3156257 RepID=UPI003514A44C
MTNFLVVEDRGGEGQSAQTGVSGSPHIEDAVRRRDKVLREEFTKTAAIAVIAHIDGL